MARLPVTTDIGGVQVTSEPLPFPRAEPLIPDVLEFIGTVLTRAGEVIKAKSINQLDIGKLGELGIDAAKYFGAGRLQRLAPLIMFSTSAPMTMLNGSIERKEFGKEPDRVAFFDERPELYFPILFFAGRVSFERFFPAWLVAGLRAGTRPSA